MNLAEAIQKVAAEPLQKNNIEDLLYEDELVARQVVLDILDDAANKDSAGLAQDLFALVGYQAFFGERHALVQGEVARLEAHSRTAKHSTFIKLKEQRREDPDLCGTDKEFDAAAVASVGKIDRTRADMEQRGAVLNAILQAIQKMLYLGDAVLRAQRSEAFNTQKI